MDLLQGKILGLYLNLKLSHSKTLTLVRTMMRQDKKFHLDLLIKGYTWGLIIYTNNWQIDISSQ